MPRFTHTLRLRWSGWLAVAALGAAFIFSAQPGVVQQVSAAETLDASVNTSEAAAVMPAPQSLEQTMLALTNADRAANGQPALDFDPDTLAIARERAEASLTTPSLTHYDADGSLIFARLLKDSQLGYQLAGENLARSSSIDASVAQRIEQALMNSPLHRKNILEQGFSRVAIGAASDSAGHIAFAEIFRSS
jgi:uncharacterized protein YkwD